jgi:superfamily I DNA/RNA helicase
MLRSYNTRHSKRTAGEELIYSKLEKLYSSQKEEGIILEDFYLPGGDLTPDFLLIDKKRGVALIEVKDYSPSYLEKISPYRIETADGRELPNPNYRVREYHNRFKSFFQRRGIEPHFFNSFLALPNFPKGADDNLFSAPPVITLYKEDIENLDFSTLFPNPQPLTSDEVTTLKEIIEPFKVVIHGSQKLEQIKMLDSFQKEIVKRKWGTLHLGGVPGSGKSAIILARALYMKQKRADWKIAVVTYNRALQDQLKQDLEEFYKFYHLNPQRMEIEITTFHSLALKLTKAHLSKKGKKEKNHFFEERLPALLLEKLEKGEIKPLYDAILIDEYQDFKPTWLKGLKLLLKPLENGELNLTLAGDRLQAIYRRGIINWKEMLGLDMRGKSILLKKSYRNNLSILRFGLNLLAQHPTLKRDVLNFYEGVKDIEGSGKNGKIELISSIGELKKRIAKLVEEGSVLIVVPNGEEMKRVRKLLPASLRKLFTLKTPYRYTITTYHSSKGLEFDSVVMLGLDRLLKGEVMAEEDKSIRLKLGYVAITRGTNNLVIHTPTPQFKKWMEELIEVNLFQEEKREK